MSTFNPGDKVTVTSSHPPYTAKVLEVLNAGYYSVEAPSGQRWSVHTSNLKPATNGGDQR